MAIEDFYNGHLYDYNTMDKEVTMMDETKAQIIRILSEALRAYAEKSNWSQSRSTGDLDQFGLRGNGFETAQEALDKALELLEEQNRQTAVPAPSNQFYGSEIITTDNTANVYHEYAKKAKQYMNSKTTLKSAPITQHGI